MSELNRFRSAIGGFHRGDVAEYIEKTAREHRTERQKWQADLAAARAEADSLRQRLSAAEAELAAYQSGQPVEKPVEDPQSEELAAYRRAEAAERSARQRIQQQTERLDEILNTVDEKCAGAGEELARAEQVLRDLKDTFAETKQAVDALRPEADL